MKTSTLIFTGLLFLMVNVTDYLKQYLKIDFMKKSYAILLFVCLCNTICLSQQKVGVNETNPQGEFHVSALYDFQGISFTGSGANDLTANTTSFSGIAEITYTITVSNAGPNPQLYDWSDSAGGSGIAVPMSHPNSLSNGLKIFWGSTTGHVFGDTWTFTVGPSFLDGLVVREGRVGIGKTIPTQALDVNGAIRIGEGTTTPYAGTLRWNSTLKTAETYNGISWETMTVDSLDNLTDVYFDNSSFLMPLSSPITNYSGVNNTSIGDGSGKAENGFSNTFFGSLAGSLVNSGSKNVSVGYSAGNGGAGTEENVYMGTQAGNGLPINDQRGNTYLGYRSGYNVLPNLIGSGNVFLGWQAGSGMSLSHKLIIDNNNLNSSNSEAPLIYGDFANNYLLLNTSERIGNETFGVSGNSSASIIINAATGFTKNPSYRFAKSGIETAKITSTALAGLEFDYSGGSNVPQKIRFNLFGEIEQFVAVAKKSTPGEWTGNSDERLKKNIKPLNPDAMLSKVIQMTGVEYEWNDKVTSLRRPVGKQIGFIAQDLKEMWPEKISEDKDGYLQTAYGTYDPVFVEAIKALNKKIEKQEKTIEMLIKKISEMEKHLNSAVRSHN